MRLLDLARPPVDNQASTRRTICLGAGSTPGSPLILSREKREEKKRGVRGDSEGGKGSAGFLVDVVDSPAGTASEVVWTPGESTSSTTSSTRIRYQVAPDYRAAPSEPRETTWPALVERLVVPCGGGVWRPAVGGRTAEEIEWVDALVLDYDDPVPLDRLRTWWAPWAAALHTTRRATRQAPRWRVVIPLAEPCPGALWPRVYHWARTRDPQVDQCCLNPNRWWRRPVRGPWWHAESWNGPPLALGPPESLPDPYAPPAPRLRVELEVDPERRRRERLWSDPDARAELGLRLGGRVGHGVARRVSCPACGRRTVWWALTRGGARCDHVTSCGWEGRVPDLDQERP